MMALVPLIAYAAFAASIITALVSVVVLKYALLIAFFLLKFLWWVVCNIFMHIQIWRIERRYRTPSYRRSRSRRSSTRFRSTGSYSMNVGDSLFARIRHRLNQPAFPRPEV